MSSGELRQSIVLFFLVERVLTGFLNWALKNSPDADLVRFLENLTTRGEVKLLDDRSFDDDKVYEFYWKHFEEFLRLEAAKASPGAKFSAAWRRSPVAINDFRQDLESLRQMRNVAMHGRDPGLRDDYKSLLSRVHAIFHKLESYLNSDVFAFEAGRALVLSERELAMLCQGEPIIPEETIHVPNRWELRFVRAPEAQSWVRKDPDGRTKPRGPLSWYANGSLWVSANSMMDANVSEITPLEALRGSVKGSFLAGIDSEIITGWSLYIPQDWANDLLGLPRWEENNPDRPLPYPCVFFPDRPRST